MYALLHTDPNSFIKLLCLDGVRRPPYIIDQAPIEGLEEDSDSEIEGFSLPDAAGDFSFYGFFTKCYNPLDMDARSGSGKEAFLEDGPMQMEVYTPFIELFVRDIERIES